MKDDCRLSHRAASDLPNRRIFPIGSDPADEARRLLGFQVENGSLGER
jgi:hypothetical protein